MKISVVVPSLNQGQFIEETICSIIHQDYSNIELIVVDGGSTDQTHQILEKYRDAIDTLIIEPDNGQSQAINKGMRRATGNVVAWLNSDDKYLPGTIRHVAEAFTNNPSIGILHGRCRLYGHHFKERIIGLTDELQIHQYLSFMRFPQPASFFNAKAWKEVGELNESLHYGMDFEWVSRAILLGVKPVRDQMIMTEYRLHPDSKSNNEVKFVKDWAGVVANTLSSFVAGKDMADDILQLLRVEANERESYSKAIDLNNEELRTILLEFLNLAYHTYYRHFEENECTRIADFIVRNYPDAYRELMLKRYQFRLKWLPHILFNIVRRIR